VRYSGSPVPGWLCTRSATSIRDHVDLGGRGAAQSADDYAATRNASGTLMLTNTGQRNAASAGTNIAVDRADVTG
jgi:hypothetical protein